MPRDEITTSFTGRTKPNTEFSRERDCITTPFSFDSTQFTFDSTEWTWDQTIITTTGCVETDYTRPRKGTFLNFADGTIYMYADNQTATLPYGSETSIIQTNWI